MTGPGVAAAGAGQPEPGAVAEIPDMTALRRRVDQLDARMVALLAERTRLIDRAAQIKLRDGLPARIDARVEEVAANVRRMAAEEGADPDLAEQVWRLMMVYFIDREDRVLSAGDATPGHAG